MTCIHYWVFEPPVKHKSIGICKFCGAKIEAVNYVELGSVSGLPMKRNLPKEQKRRHRHLASLDGEGVLEKE